jgi:hypothetical protein
MELSVAHQFLVYADVNLQGEDINTIKKKRKALLSKNKEIGLDGNTEKN